MSVFRGVVGGKLRCFNVSFAGCSGYDGWRRQGGEGGVFNIVGKARGEIHEDLIPIGYMYTLEDEHGTWEYTPGKGKSSSKQSFSGSMLIFRGCIVYLLTWMVDIVNLCFCFKHVLKNISIPSHGTIVYSPTFSWILMVNSWVNIPFIPWGPRHGIGESRSMDRFQETFFSPRLKKAMLGNYF